MVADMCKQYDDYQALTKQAAAAKMRGEHDYSLVLLRMRAFPIIPEAYQHTNSMPSGRP